MRNLFLNRSDGDHVERMAHAPQRPQAFGYGGDRRSVIEAVSGDVVFPHFNR